MRFGLNAGYSGARMSINMELVKEADKLGFHSVWAAEAYGSDAVTPVAWIAGQTEKIHVGTAIMQMPARTPAMTAMTATTLDQLSGGRFLLGLGVSGPQVVEGWHGVRYTRPIRRLREVIDIVRLISSGEKSAYDGEIFHLPLPGGEGKAIRSRAKPQPNIPIYLATLSPNSLELTGEVADGWLGTSFMPEHADVFFEHIARGAKKAGRSLARSEEHTSEL